MEKSDEDIRLEEKVEPAIASDHARNQCEFSFACDPAGPGICIAHDPVLTPDHRWISYRVLAFWVAYLYRSTRRIGSRMTSATWTLQIRILPNPCTIHPNSPRLFHPEVDPRGGRSV